MMEIFFDSGKLVLMKCRHAVKFSDMGSDWLKLRNRNSRTAFTAWPEHRGVVAHFSGR